MKIGESTILIVDDDIDIINQTKKILENLGTNILFALNVADAMQILRTATPHLIVTDLGMAPQSGFDFLRQLKENRVLSSIPVVVLSVSNERSSVYKAISLGALDYIIKPIKTSNFLRKLRRSLKDLDFLKYELSTSDNKQVNLAVSGSIHSTSDISIRIDATTCFSPNSTFSIRDPNPNIEGFEQISFMMKEKGLPHVRGTYLNEFIAIPAEGEFQNIKRKLQ